MLRFVLVEPAVPENVGAAARALKTMGFGSLWIVNSRAFEAKQAKILAHGSGEILDQARHFSSLEAVRNEVDLMVGTSAKPRHHRDVLLSPQDLKTNLADKLGAGANVALVFGREESGLHSAEIALCDLLTSLPLAAPYPSLNLGQAVMLYAYALSDLDGETRSQSGDAGQYRALREKALALSSTLGYTPECKFTQWMLEHLPLLDTRSLGFMHQLVDKMNDALVEAKPGARSVDD